MGFVSRFSIYLLVESNAQCIPSFGGNACGPGSMALKFLLALQWGVLLQEWFSANRDSFRVSTKIAQFHAPWLTTPVRVNHISIETNKRLTPVKGKERGKANRGKGIKSRPPCPPSLRATLLCSITISPGTRSPLLHHLPARMRCR
jgi:hypothetical protein